MARIALDVTRIIYAYVVTVVGKKGMATILLASISTHVQFAG